MLNFSTSVCLFYRVLTTVRTASSGSACRCQLRLYCHSVRAGGANTRVRSASHGLHNLGGTPIGTHILFPVFARKQRVKAVQRRRPPGNRGTTILELFYSLLAQDLRSAATSCRGRVFHDLRVVSMTVNALGRTILVDYDLLLRNLLRLSMALCASHRGVTTGQRQVGLVMVKR